MIPKTDNYSDLITDDFEYVLAPSRTYSLNAEEGKFNIGYIDGIEAVKQAIYLVLLTERYDYIIYDEYGVEIKYLFGREDSFVIPELERVITEAVLRDDRVTNVSNFKITKNKDAMLCTFTVHSVFGDFEAEKEVLV